MLGFLHHKKKKTHKIWFALLIGTAVVSFWRGMWGIMDVLIFPNDYLASSIVSLGLGLSILAITHYIVKELM